MPPVGTIPRFRRCFFCRTAGTPLVIGLRFITLTLSQLSLLRDQNPSASLMNSHISF
jgi:hypothetical protein